MNKIYCILLEIIKKLFVIILIIALNFNIQAESNYNYKEYSEDNTTNIHNEVYDPYEKLNRKIFAFNSILDH